MTTLKKPIFIGFFGLFHFLFFSFFLFLGLQHKKGKNKKCNFLFENLIFDIPQIENLIFDIPQICKNTILTHCDTICVSKNAQKHYKTGEKQQKSWTSF